MEVQRELSEIIRSGIKDPRIHPMTSVVAVEVTPDLNTARHISVFWATRKQRRRPLRAFAAPLPMCAESLQEE